MKTKIKKSLIGYCVLYFSLFSGALLLLFIVFNLFIESKLQEVELSLDDLLNYEEYLKNDEINKIPLKKFSKNEIIIFDELNRVFFRTNNYVGFSLQASDLNYIINYYDDDYYYDIKEYSLDNGQKRYYITKNIYEEDASYEKLLDYALLDEDYNILEGEAFADKKFFTQEELELLNGYITNRGYIEKYEYETDEGLKRTLVFLEKPLEEKMMEKKVNHIYILWFYIIPVIFIFEMTITYLFYQKIKKMIKPLEKIIENYEENDNLEYEDDDIPREFRPLFKSFKKLLSKLNMEKVKTDKIYKDKQSVIANISHDLKTPLTVIKGYAKALKDDIVPEQKKKMYIDAIYNKSEIATAIINSLFEYTQMEHLDFKANFVKTDFNEFCREYLALKYTDLELQGYGLEFELLDKPFIKSFDAKLITRLFDNIIINSVKHNKKGIKIYFKLKVKNNKVNIIIADNGKGIAIKDEQVLFKAFEMVSTARDNGGGTGLGLFIAKRVVEIHDGTIKIVTKPRKPYKFAIDITI